MDAIKKKMQAMKVEKDNAENNLKQLWMPSRRRCRQ